MSQTCLPGCAVISEVAVKQGNLELTIRTVVNINMITRRSFLKGAAASAAFPLFTIAGTKSSGRVLGANDVIRVGVAGIHGQGNAHIDQYLGLKNVQVTHLIDPDRSLFASRGEKIREQGGNQPK